jgi:hypothetical protein
VAILPADTNTQITTWQLALKAITNYILQVKQKVMTLLFLHRLGY